jgi:hypothetical protein
MLLKPDELRLVEVKAADGRVSSIQAYRHSELQMLGFNVEIIKP